MIPGQAIAHKEGDRPFDLFLDLRPMLDDIRGISALDVPPSKESLLTSAQRFSKKNPKARFALRLWSSAYFYPLMLSLDNRDATAFYDAKYRAWGWKFAPKDMPYSEWSIHRQAQTRIQPYKHILGRNVKIRKDIFLVMGGDDEELFKMAVGMTFAIQTAPWRLEVDWWRSFVNVDFAFLEKLDTRWLD
ncbi:MAG: hypothetical protein M1834_001106 [Cirrosporium novae-zelandiae]|nr:MAG: hypothetical protein M1834_001106 [Cirrosporium novae-zelandiae]